MKKTSNSVNSSEEYRAFCPYCGCGCSLIYKQDSQDNKISRAIQDSSDPVSRGKSCIKGLTSYEMLNVNRIQHPMIRENKNADLQECSWEEAYAFVKNKLGRIPLTQIRDKVYFVGSGEVVNESNYLFSKLCRSHFKSNNIDSCARLCHAATAHAFKRVFGVTGIPDYGMDDVASSDTFLFIGTDPAEDYPVLFNRILEAKGKGAKIITVDVASNTTTELADLNINISPNGILPLIASLISDLVRGRDVSRKAKHISGYSRFIDSVEDIVKNHPVSQHGVKNEEMKDLYNLINDSKNLCIGFGMGLTQHLGGTQNVYAVSALSILMDAILFPGRGKVNVQGAVDVGAEPGWSVSEGFKAFGIEIPALGWSRFFEAHEGLEMTEALYSDEVEFVWILASNPSQSMPDLNALDESFKKKFIVLQHHHKCRSMEFADVVLPGTVLAEEYGSVTNCERRVRGQFKNGLFGWDLLKKSEIKTNSQIILEFAKSLDAKGFEFESPEQIFEEMVKVVPGYSGIDLDSVSSSLGEFAEKTPLYKEFVKLDYDHEHFETGENYDFILTTARLKFQFCTGEGTSNTKALNDMSGPVAVSMNIKDAINLNLESGDSVKIKSSVGEIVAKVELDKSIDKRVVVAPYHFEKLLINRLTPRILDPESKTPSFKYVGVNIEKV